MGGCPGMIYHRIADCDDAYANGTNVPGGDRWPEAWVAPSSAYREERAGAGRAKLGLSYGERARNRFDLFLPTATRRASSSSSMAATGCASTRPTGRIWRAAPSRAAMPSPCPPTRCAPKSASPASSPRWARPSRCGRDDRRADPPDRPFRRRPSRIADDLRQFAAGRARARRASATRCRSPACTTCAR